MRFFSAVSLVSLLACATALPSSSDHVVHERREASLKQWQKREGLGSRSKLPMRIGLKQSNLDRGHDLLMEVYVAVL